VLQNFVSAEKSLAIQGQRLAQVDEEPCLTHGLNHGFVERHPSFTDSHIFLESPFEWIMEKIWTSSEILLLALLVIEIQEENC
jgi:hypothetical protein